MVDLYWQAVIPTSCQKVRVVRCKQVGVGVREVVIVWQGLGEWILGRGSDHAFDLP